MLFMYLKVLETLFCPMFGAQLVKARYLLAGYFGEEKKKGRKAKVEILGQVVIVNKRWLTSKKIHIYIHTHGGLQCCT